MSQGIKIIILIIAGLIAIGLIIFYIVPRAPAVAPQSESSEKPSPRSLLAPQGETLQGNPEPVSVVPSAPSSPIPEADTSQATLSSAARSFIQRYGTFSGDAAFSNITDLYPVMSTAFRVRSETYVQKTQIPRKSSDPLTITTTTVLSVQLAEIPLGATTTTATVKTQRTQIKGSDAPKTWYQDLALIFIKEDGVWKVDSAVWK